MISKKDFKKINDYLWEIPKFFRQAIDVPTRVYSGNFFKKNMTRFEQFEHQADVGIRGYGTTLEEAFENGAKAMFSVMTNLEKVELKKEIEIECQAHNLEELFVEWLNKLLSEAGIGNLVFSDFKIKEIKKVNSNYRLSGLTRGEELNLEKHEPRVEVKAATYSQLKAEKKGNQYIVQTIVDV